VVVVTVTGSVAVCPVAPLKVNVQVPAATGDTVNELPLPEIVAIPLHEFAWPVAAVDGVNAPL
jgi:hypothetical protein